MKKNEKQRIYGRNNSFPIKYVFLRESLKLHNNQPWALSPALFPLIITFVALLFSISLIIKGIGKSSVNRENGELK